MLARFALICVSLLALTACLRFWRFAWFARSGAHVGRARGWFRNLASRKLLTFPKKKEILSKLKLSMILLKASPRGWFWNLVGDSSTWPNFYAHKKFDAHQNIHVLGIFVYLTYTLPIFSELKKLSIYREISLESWSWAWFFWRPLQQGNFENFLQTLQLHRNPNPIWFCNCKLWYTVWDIWESQLIHIRF